MPTIFIDGKEYRYEGEGKSLLEVCLSLGFDVPYFCWHPAMHAVGACRQCAVKVFTDAADTRGKIVMSCMTAAVDGMRVSIDDPEVVDFRARVIEWLMINHPHDCAVCDEGGECHLQDMTVMTGHVYRRYRFDKRTYRNQDLGPFIHHEMNRCIQCYRCVRFYRDYADGRDLDVFGAHDHVYFGRFADGALESPFSGNLVEVCPTGVFTDKVFKGQYARKWDLTTAPSVCTLCGHGCNILPGARFGTLRRVRNRFNHAVNSYFICDRGRYGFQFVNGEYRVRTPLLREGDELRAASVDEALTRIRELLQSGSMAGIGSPRASVEANYALRALVGAERFSHGLPEQQFALLAALLALQRSAMSPSPTLPEVEQADAVIILGEDLANTAPRLELAVRQAARIIPDELEAAALGILPFDDAALREAAQGATHPLFLCVTGATSLDALATVTYRAVPDELARLALAVAHRLDASAPAVTDLAEDVAALADRMAEILRNARRPLLICGASAGSLALIAAAGRLLAALEAGDGSPMLRTVAPACNSMGQALLGGVSLEEAATAETLIVLDSEQLRPAQIAGAKQIVCLDSLLTEISERADTVLPAATFAESAGTLVGSDGLAQRFFQVFVPEGEIRTGWQWCDALMAGRWANLDALITEIATESPAFARICAIAPPADFRILEQKVPRQSHRFSGRTAMTANVSVNEPPPPDDPDSPLAFSMEGAQKRPPAPLVPRFWTPGWNSAQAVHKFQEEVGGPLRGSEIHRVIEPDGSTLPPVTVPSAFTPREGELLILPAYHLFGTEPLSMLTPGIAELAPAPYLALHPADAARLGVKAGGMVTLTLGGTTHTLSAALRDDVPRGAALLPVGIVDSPVPLPAWGTMERGRHA